MKNKLSSMKILLISWFMCSLNNNIYLIQALFNHELVLIVTL